VDEAKNLMRSIDNIELFLSIAFTEGAELSENFAAVKEQLANTVRQDREFSHSFLRYDDF